MSKKRVMIVEDDALLVRALQISLLNKGHDVTTCLNGVDAVKSLMDARPDVVVLDLRLPDCDGWFLVELIKKLEACKDLPLIFMSVLEPDQRKLRDCKPCTYIQKPFDISQLMHEVDRSLRHGYPPGPEVFM